VFVFRFTQRVLIRRDLLRSWVASHSLALFALDTHLPPGADMRMLVPPNLVALGP